MRARGSAPSSVKVILSCLFGDDIKRWLCAEPSRKWASNCLLCKHSVLLGDFDGLVSASIGGRVCHELGVTALLQALKPEYRRFDSFSHCQESMILKHRSFLVAESFCDLLTLLVSQDNAVKRCVIGNILFPPSVLDVTSWVYHLDRLTLWKAQAS